MIRALYRHRWLLYELVARDMTLRYRGTALGFLWTLLTPLLFMAVYLMVFSVFLRIGVPHYAAFLLAGLLPWQWFAGSLLSGTAAILEGRTYVGGAVVAPITLVAVPIISSFLHFLLSLPVLIVVLLFLGMHVGWSLAALPLLFAMQILLTLGLVLLLATFNVFYRDCQQLVGVLLMLFFYLVPIIYPIAAVPERFRVYAMADPMSIIILNYHAIFYDGVFPSLWWDLVAVLISALIFIAGRLVFNRYEEILPDYL